MQPRGIEAVDGDAAVEALGEYEAAGLFESGGGESECVNEKATLPCESNTKTPVDGAEAGDGFCLYGTAGKVAVMLEGPVAAPPRRAALAAE